MKASKPQKKIEKRFKYFAATEKNSLSPQDISQLPIAYAFAGLKPGEAVARPAIGPDGLPGYMIAFPGDEDGTLYSSENDNWTEVDKPHEASGWTRCFIGYPKDTPYPTPTELLRPDIKIGIQGVDHPLVRFILNQSPFGDGQNWQLPTACLFDETATEKAYRLSGGKEALVSAFIEFQNSSENEPDISKIAPLEPVLKSNCPTSFSKRGGTWVQSDPIEEYRKIFELGLHANEKLRDAPDWVDSNEAKDIVVELFQVFYLVGATELSLMGTLTENAFRVALAVLCDNESYLSWVQKKIAEVAPDVIRQTAERISESTSEETSDSSSGQPVVSPDTLQPSQT